MKTLEKESEIRALTGVLRADFGEVIMTPDKATKILNRFNTKNRKLSSKIAEQYAQDMRRDLWVRSNDAITFDDNWELSNGQHRLKAITLANKPIRLTIGFRVNQSTEMDRGKQRTIFENIGLSDKVRNESLREDKKVTEVANVILRAIVNQKIIRTDDVIELINKYEKEFKECIDNGLFTGTSGVGQAGVSAAFLIALINKVPLDTLVYVRQVLNSGVAIDSSKDKPIIGLRDKLQAVRGGGQGQTVSRVKYTQYGINAVINGKGTKTCKCNEYLYKLK